MKKFGLWIFAVGLISMVAAIAAGTEGEGRMPDLGGAVAWLNSAPLSAKSLRGKVVLVNFWTYSCINSLRELPYIAGWAAKYKDSGLVVIGVHTPEFGFEGEFGSRGCISSYGRRGEYKTGHLRWNSSTPVLRHFHSHLASLK